MRTARVLQRILCSIKHQDVKVAKGCQVPLDGDVSQPSG